MQVGATSLSGAETPQVVQLSRTLSVHAESLSKTWMWAGTLQTTFTLRFVVRSAVRRDSLTRSLAHSFARSLASELCNWNRRETERRLDPCGAHVESAPHVRDGPAH